MQVAQQAVHATIHSLLTLLDGDGYIEGFGDGEFRLEYTNETGRISLAGHAEGQCLHELYQCEVYDEVFGPPR